MKLLHVFPLLALVLFLSQAKAGDTHLGNYSIGFNYLETNSDQVHKASLPLLKRLAKDLVKSPNFQSLVVEGHTDSYGDNNYNMILSQRRADKIRKVLIGMGVPANKIRAVGLGPTHPIASNAQDQGRALNRRIELKVQWQKEEPKTAAADMDLDP